MLIVFFFVEGSIDSTITTRDEGVVAVAASRTMLRGRCVAIEGYRLL